MRVCRAVMVYRCEVSRNVNSISRLLLSMWLARASHTWGGMSNWHLDERLQNCRFFCSFLSWWPNEHKTIRCKIRLEVVFIFSQHFSALEIILKHSFWYRVNKAQTHCATTPVSSSSTRHHHHSFSPSKEHRASTGALQRTRLFVNVLVLSQE